MEKLFSFFSFSNFNVKASVAAVHTHCHSVGVLGAYYWFQNKITRKYLHIFVWLHLCENVKPEAEAVHAKHIFSRSK